jgi:putative transposase
VSRMCDMLEISRGGYYDWAGRPLPARRRRQAKLVEQIRVAHRDGRGLYGSPRVTAELKEAGVSVCENTVAKLMKAHEIRAKTVRHHRPRTTDSQHAWAPAANVLGRDFAAPTPDAKWCCDLTYIETAEGFLYLAAVLDLCSRRIVGWSMAPHLRATLCVDALEMAALHRRPSRKLIHHSDRGVQYCCDGYQQKVKALGLTVSMSGRGDCYDNAPMESFWGTLKQELLYLQPGGRFTSHADARRKIFEYIEVFYNRKRRHSALGYLSPEAFEASLN